MVNAYAGIGSRTISHTEALQIDEAAKWLASHDYVVYSGNADGADIAFQRGSGGRCVIMLPWVGFNEAAYPTKLSLAAIPCGDTEAGRSSTDEHHPNAAALTRGARAMMSRNHHQVAGIASWPLVDFVLFCADEGILGVKGGTGQAVRIARSLGIPTVNLRATGWQQALTGLVVSLQNS